MLSLTREESHKKIKEKKQQKCCLKWATVWKNCGSNKIINGKSRKNKTE